MNKIKGTKMIQILILLIYKYIYNKVET